MRSHDLSLGADDNRVLRERRDNARRDVVVVGLRDHEDRILLVQTRRFPDWWQPIGGGIDASDTTPVAALVREVEEEVDLRLRPHELDLIVQAPYDFGEGIVHCYQARIGARAATISFNPREILGHRWVGLNEARTLPVFPATQQFLTALSDSEHAR